MPHIPSQPKPRRHKYLLRCLCSLPLIVPLLCLGAMAVLHLVCLESDHPLVRFVVLEGSSMTPTYAPGEQLVFGRREWRPGSVVLAKVPGEEPVVKRVVGRRNGWVLVTGDNTEDTTSYLISPDDIMATLLFSTRLVRRGHSAAPPR